MYRKYLSKVNKQVVSMRFALDATTIAVCYADGVNSRWSLEK